LNDLDPDAMSSHISINSQYVVNDVIHYIEEEDSPRNIDD